MDRASDFGSEGWRFESVRAHQHRHFAETQIGFLISQVTAMIIRFDWTTPSDDAKYITTLFPVLRENSKSPSEEISGRADASEYVVWPGNLK